MAAAAILLAALAGIGLAQARAASSGQEESQAFLGAVFGASTMALVLMYALRARIESRAIQVEEGIDILLQLTRMLWSSGMTIEMMFRQLALHLQDISPHLSFEISVALGRIESGQVREDVLELLAKCQPCSGMADYFRMLAQISVSGGRALQSLQVLSDLLRDSRRTRLQEKLTKMSGKMSLVMMLCFFPAMLIFMAGPAAINLGGALGALTGN